MRLYWVGIWTRSRQNSLTAIVECARNGCVHAMKSIVVTLIHARGRHNNPGEGGIFTKGTVMQSQEDCLRRL